MSRALYTAATGMIAQQMNVDNIANKPGEREYDWIQEEQARVPGPSVSAVAPRRRDAGRGRAGSRRAANRLRNPAGRHTADLHAGHGHFDQQSLDVSIDGDGFIGVTLPDGTIAYTRDGALKKSAEGTIVTSDGYTVDPQVTIPQDATAINISSNGEVSVKIPGDPTLQQLGQIELSRFVNPAGLKTIGAQSVSRNRSFGYTGDGGLLIRKVSASCPRDFSSSPMWRSSTRW